MDDTRPREIIEALELEKRAIDLEKDLDNLQYNFKKARNAILNELTKIRLREGELSRTHGVNVWSHKTAT